MSAKQRVSTPTPKGKEPSKVAVQADAALRPDGRKERPYEFGGNLGTAFWTFFIPAAVIYAYGVNVINHGQPCVPDRAFVEKLIWGLPDGVAVRPTQSGFYLLTGWLLLQFSFQQFMPGKIELNRPLTNGNRLPYKLNGWKSWCATWALVGWYVYGGWLEPTVLFKQFGSMMAWAQIYSYGVSLYLYVHFGLLWKRWKDSPEYESDWGVMRLTDFFHDYWMGTARNPRVLHFLGYPFDFKFFFEARPGLILWVLINWSNVAALYYGCGIKGNKVVCNAEGDWSRVPLAAFIISFSHTYYIFDYFWHEIAILTTTDIIHEPFGFMLMWGDMGFLPWMYTNSFTVYLVYAYPKYEGHPALDALCIGLWVLAMALFRLTNIQKNNFRTFQYENADASGKISDAAFSNYKVWGKPVEYVRASYNTKEGVKENLMLCSGFWGMCRHPNYAPDMIMAFAWFLNCTYHKNVPLVPFGYVIYFWMMDIHRFFRDEERCYKKYGEDWKKYCAKVPSKLIPGVW